VAIVAVTVVAAEIMLLLRMILVLMMLVRMILVLMMLVRMALVKHAVQPVRMFVYLMLVVLIHFEMVEPA
jgi:hypothetical protein